MNHAHTALLALLLLGACGDLLGADDGPPCDQACAKIEACLPAICDGDEACEKAARCEQQDVDACEKRLEAGEAASVDCILRSGCSGVAGCQGLAGP